MTSTEIQVSLFCIVLGSHTVFPRVAVIHNESVNEMIQERAFEEASERLIFNEKTGTLIKLSNGRRTAERKRPLDEFNNGVVMTNRPIKDEEMFEVRVRPVTHLVPNVAV